MFNIISVIFSLFSLTMVVPLLGVLFGIQPIVTKRPDLSFFDMNSVIDLFYFEVSKLILDGAGQITLEGQMSALVLICGFRAHYVFHEELVPLSGAILQRTIEKFSSERHQK